MSSLLYSVFVSYGDNHKSTDQKDQVQKQKNGVIDESLIPLEPVTQLIPLEPHIQLTPSTQSEKLIHTSKDLAEAYAFMLKYKEIIANDSVTIELRSCRKARVCRICKIEISPLNSGCLIHLNDFDIVTKHEIIDDFSSIKFDIHKFNKLNNINFNHQNNKINDPINDPINDSINDNVIDNINNGNNEKFQNLKDESHFSDSQLKSEPQNKDKLDGNKFRCLIGSGIVLEGLIGIGKSTLGRSLERYLLKMNLKAKFFPEFVDDKLLSLYISDMKRYAFPFQVIIARERLRVFREARDFSLLGGISIIDRNIIGDLAFASMQKEKGFITDSEWLVYQNLIQFDSDLKSFSEQFINVFLQGTPDQAFERMRKRSFNSEVGGYTIEYFQDLDKSYQNIISSIGIKYLYVPWYGDKKTEDGYLNDSDCHNFLNTVRDYFI